MTGILLRVLIYVIIFGAIYFGIKRIISDWKSKFSELDQQDRERDKRERKGPGVIDLKRDRDGVFRPGDGRDDDKKQP